MNISKKKINLSSFSNVKQIELEKAYIEGVYCDSPANRKLGRVGMTYAAYAEKVKAAEKDNKISEKEAIPSHNLEDMLFDSSDGSLKDLSKDKITDMLLNGDKKELEFTDYKNTYLAKKEKPNGGEERVNYYKLNKKEILSSKKEEKSIKFDLVEAERGIYDLHPNPVELKTTSSYVKKIPASESKYGSICYEVFLEFKDGKKINSTSERLNNQTEAKKWIENEIKGYNKEKKEIEDKNINLKQELEKTHASALKKDDNGNMVATFETSFAKAEINKIPASMTNKGHNLFQPTITSINGDNKWRSTDEEFSSKEEAEKWIKKELSKHLDNETSKKEENNKKVNVDKILAKSDDLGRAKGKRLDAIISYAKFDNVPKDATDEEKRKIIAENYIKSAELSGTPEEIANDLDEIVEDAIADYVPPKEKDDTEERKKLSYMEARTVLSHSDTLANATTKQLDNVINYSGFDIDKKLSDDEKREKLAQKYYASADLYELTSAKDVANALDGIIEDALEDYVPPKK